ncbi:hypothetical protein RVR_6049 [Actinacidiphila reveromycinica]|uniref:Uncharacterized protein n=1 Tax=Actinacidiphila reveromycinica TaxID=659352 RepID=A0A7U3UVA2_9ACTN|nr:hypothetical protein [Streptomyces sp. SN-593]BBA99434.1 hypothetical protein RVR_6049 [Streptomyces sp. SN-593]
MSPLAAKANDSSELAAVPLRSTDVQRLASTELQPILSVVVVTSTVSVSISATGGEWPSS